jgi:hypothetical protein
MTTARTGNRSILNGLVAGALALWLALVLLLGASGAFVGAPGAPPLPILLGATVPKAQTERSRRLPDQPLRLAGAARSGLTGD